MSRKHPVVVALGDMQIDLHDEKFLTSAVRFIKDVQPDIICLTGDECDATSIGRWVKGQLGEVGQILDGKLVTLQDQVDLTVRWLKKISGAAPNARVFMAHSNHMERFESKTMADALGFHSLRCLKPEVMFSLADMGIEYCRQEKEFLPGFVLAHGHQYGLTSASHLNQGINHVRRMGRSLLAGHCHQPGLRTTFQGVGGSGDLLTYVNAGCAMDFGRAMAYNGGYLKGGSPDWGHAVVLIERHNGRNHTNLIVAQDRVLRWQGRTY